MYIEKKWVYKNLIVVLEIQNFFCLKIPPVTFFLVFRIFKHSNIAPFYRKAVRSQLPGRWQAAHSLTDDGTTGLFLFCFSGCSRFCVQSVTSHFSLSSQVLFNQPFRDFVTHLMSLSKVSSQNILDTTHIFTDWFQTWIINSHCLEMATFLPGFHLHQHLM